MIYFCSPSEWMSLFEEVPSATDSAAIGYRSTTTLSDALFSKSESYTFGSPTAATTSRGDFSSLKNANAAATITTTNPLMIRSVVASPAVVYVRVPRASVIAAVDAMLLGRSLTPRDAKEALDMSKRVEAHAAYKAMVDQYNYAFGHPPPTRAFKEL